MDISQRYYTRSLLLTLCFMSVFSLTGCMTGDLWKNNPVNTVEDVKYDLFTDTLIASFRYTHFDLERDTTLKAPAEYRKAPDSGLAFVGEKYIYLITAGETELTQLNELLKTTPPENIITESNITPLYHYNVDKLSPVPHFSGYINISVTPSPESDKQTTIKPRDICKIRCDGKNRIAFTLAGMIFTREQLTFSYAPEKNLAMNYKIKFRTSQKENVRRPGRAVANTAATPFVLVADAIAAPVFLLGAPVFMLFGVTPSDNK